VAAGRFSERAAHYGLTVLVRIDHQGTGIGTQRLPQMDVAGQYPVDLGPGAGHDGGRLVFEGTPAELVAQRSTLTGEHLAEYVG
jgi:excinuclease UvrABC ATPase subunit